jgi:hypothetical protein
MVFALSRQAQGLTDKKQMCITTGAALNKDDNLRFSRISGRNSHYSQRLYPKNGEEQKLETNPPKQRQDQRTKERDAGLTKSDQEWNLYPS